MSQFEEMVKFLDFSWSLKDQIVPCLIGPVGIGKTAAVEQHAKNVGAKNVVKIVASQILPNEVSGITMPNDKTCSMDIYDHYRLSSMSDGDILFFDELLEADQSVLKACLTLIESRELMSGKKLPDIQIIAATNPTIMASTLAENIRQRFMFKKFDLDTRQAIEYIKKDTGMDLEHLRHQIKCEGPDYNILTPRSLTKMARWCMSVDKDDLESWAKSVNDMFDTDIGSVLVQARKLAEQDPETLIRKKMKQVWLMEAFEKVDDYDHRDMPKPDFKNDSFTDLEKKLNDLGVWKIFEDALKNDTLEEHKLELY